MLELVRFPAVAGTFYPASRAALDKVVGELLLASSSGRAGGPPGDAGPRVKAIIAPHAGYEYSGPIAASAFARLAPHGESLRRVVLVGPAHRVPLDGLASPGVPRLRTPLGDVEVDLDALELVPEVTVHSMAHAREHSLEVELPFLQRVAPHAKVVPLVVGRVDVADVVRTLETLWGGLETAIVISSDLSHYLPYEQARALDRVTADRIVALDAAPIGGADACGAPGINGLLGVARARKMYVDLLDLRSSGDTAGSRNEVVGYGAFAFVEAS